jgi:hypothetical protein
MFIDEAYSLGNEDKKDSYAKECMDTINQNLTEKKDGFLCIIAGYEQDLDKCFFAYNEGLKRRFPFVYTIDKYTHEDLKSIFYQMMTKQEWKLSISQKDLSTIFKDNYNLFPNMAGDMETLVFNCKLEHSSRVFCLNKSFKNNITKIDIINALSTFKKRLDNTLIKNQESSKDIVSSMYT